MKQTTRQTKPENVPETMRLVYGLDPISGGEFNLVFIPEFEAFRLASIYNAIKSESWGEFYDKMPPADLKEVTDLLEEVRGELPARTDQFDSSELPGLCDGDWPTWPAQEMMRWLPREVWTQYSKSETSMLNGYFITIDPMHEKDIVRDLVRAGYRCRRDDALVRRACGN